MTESEILRKLNYIEQRIKQMERKLDDIESVCKKIYSELP